MRGLRCCPWMAGALALFLASGCASPRVDEVADDTASFINEVSFSEGSIEFREGDDITIESIRGTASRIRQGGTYLVRGTYTLGSHDRANLLLANMVTQGSGRDTIDEDCLLEIERGTGRFELRKTITQPGFLHLTFYPIDGGDGFGGVFFGQGDGVLKAKPWSYLESP